MCVRERGGGGGGLTRWGDRVSLSAGQVVRQGHHSDSIVHSALQISEGVCVHLPSLHHLGHAHWVEVDHEASDRRLWGVPGHQNTAALLQ